MAKIEQQVIWMYKQGFTFEDMLSLDIPRFKLLEGLYYAYKETNSEFYKEEYWKHCVIEKFHDKAYLILGDDHRGSKSENPDYTEKAFAMAKNLKIQTILHGGDIGDGMIDPSPEYNTPEKQLEHIIDTYPKIEGMSHYITLGNHDKRYKNIGLNLEEILSERRPDIHILGWNLSYIRIHSHLVSLEHGLESYKNHPDWYLAPKMRFVSHTHGMDIGRPLTFVPSLCENDISCFKNVGKKYRPGFLILNVDSESNYDLFGVSGYQFTSNGPKKTDEKSFYLHKPLTKIKK